MGRLSGRRGEGHAKWDKGSVEPNTPDPAARNQVSLWDFSGLAPMAVVALRPLAGLPTALRGGTATPSTTGCSSSTRTAALPKRVIWHVRGKGRLRSKHL